MWLYLVTTCNNFKLRDKLTITPVIFFSAIICVDILLQNKVHRENGRKEFFYFLLTIIAVLTVTYIYDDQSQFTTQPHCSVKYRNKEHRTTPQACPLVLLIILTLVMPVCEVKFHTLSDPWTMPA
ncbi:hypothetical protein JOM56_006882 [Amanita muscaria]